MEYTRLGSFRPQGQPDRARLHELRRHVARLQRVGPRRRRGGADLPPGRRARHHLLGHRQRLRLSAPRRRSSAARIKKYTRREDIVLATKVYFPMHDGPGGSGPVPQGDHGADRRLADPARHRLRRPLPDPPLRPGRPRSRRRWRPCTTSSRPARPATSAPRRCGPGSSPRCSTPPSRTAGRGSSPCRTSTACMQREEEREMFGLLADQGVGSIPWSPLAKGRLARPWGGADHARSETPDRTRRPPALRSTATTGRSSTPCSGSPRPAASRWRRSRWPGCCKNPVVAAPIVGPTKPHHLADAVAASTSSSPTTRSASWKRPMYRGVRPGSHRIPTRAADAERP